MDAEGNQIIQPPYIPEGLPERAPSSDGNRPDYENQTLNYVQDIRLKMVGEILKDGPLPKSKADVMQLGILLGDVEKQALAKMRIKQDAKDTNAHLAMAAAVLSSLTGKSMQGMIPQTMAPVTANTAIPSIENKSTYQARPDEMRTEEHAQTYQQFRAKMSKIAKPAVTDVDTDNN